MQGSTRLTSPGSKISARMPIARFMARLFSNAGRMAGVTAISAPHGT